MRSMVSQESHPGSTNDPFAMRSTSHPCTRRSGRTSARASMPPRPRGWSTRHPSRWASDRSDHPSPSRAVGRRPAPGSLAQSPDRMSGLRVLITNYTLATRTGTETYVRDLALGLARRGRHPIVYSTHLGEIAREIEAGTVPVIDDLGRLGTPPDVIHGHHFAETLTALL